MSTSGQMLTIARFSLWEALRDRFLWLILIGLFVAFFLSVFIGELAITESLPMKTAILAYVLRLFAVFTVSLFVITSMLREFNDKGFELILSHPVNRATYYFGKFSGYAAIAFIICIGIALCLFTYIPKTESVLWVISLYCELLIIVALSLLCLFTLNSVTLAFTMVVCFYLLSRTIEAIQLISDAPIMDHASISHQFIDRLIETLAYLIPDLYKFTRTDWLIYGLQDTGVLAGILIQTVVYLTLLVAAALFDLYRKEL